MSENEKIIGVTWWDLGRLFLALVVLGLAVGSFFFASFSWGALGLTITPCHPGQLMIFYPIICMYIAVSAFAVCVVAIIKRGFSNLKGIKDKGLIWGLIWGFIVCAIVDLIWGFIGGILWGSIKGLSWELIWGFIVGLIWGLIVGLIWGFIGGFMVGLVKEFNI